MKQAKPGTCPRCSCHHKPDHVCRDEYEGWTYWELRENEDYAGLVAHCRAVVDWRLGELDGLCALGLAYVLNREPAKAISLLSESHRKEPSVKSLQRVILDALFAQGKDETSFDWVELMSIDRLDSSIVDRCHETMSFSLGSWGENYSAAVLYEEISREGYCVFTPEELLVALQQDERFIVEEEGDYDPGVRLARGSKQEESGIMKTSQELFSLTAQSKAREAVRR